MKKLLIIEDSVDHQRGYKWINMSSGNKLELIQATTFADAERILKREVIDTDECNIDAISFDFNLDGNNSSIKLIDMIHGRFHKIMIAASNDPGGRKTQILLGCTHELEDKTKLIEFVLNMLEKDEE